MYFHHVNDNISKLALWGKKNTLKHYLWSVEIQ